MARFENALGPSLGEQAVTQPAYWRKQAQAAYTEIEDKTRAYEQLLQEFLRRSQAIRALHWYDADGRCHECRQPRPCNTNSIVDDWGGIENVSRT